MSQNFSLISQNRQGIFRDIMIHNFIKTNLVCSKDTEVVQNHDGEDHSNSNNSLKSTIEQIFGHENSTSEPLNFSQIMLTPIN